ncbi:terminase gpA endonuclease subunit [Schlesneria sp.]|uniref:terminase gpA endonuclease subunit n=1 Tax=Schlesneria sp. TaxID=2762018 RepID=UPI002EF3CF96
MLTGISPHVIDVLKEKDFVPTAQWAAENIVMPRGSEIKGAYRHDLFPHVREVFEAFDDPTIERITLQWASRVGKTACFISCLVKMLATDPVPMAFADADESSVKRVLGRIWDTLDGILCLKDRLPPRHLRNQLLIDVGTCVIRGAWSGSPASAADYGAKVIVKNEASKMSKNKSREAPFEELIDERAKGFAGRKILQASTPTQKGKCYIERERLSGDNRARLVPCPHCNFFQELVEGDAEYSREGKFLGLSNGGLRWEHSKGGHSTPEIALQTAWYECCRCKKKIREEHRFEMLNAGVWVPEGCTVDSRGKLKGNPVRKGNHASFGPLSTLHSLIPGVTLGMVAAESVRSKMKGHGIEDPRGRRRNCVNSWFGLTWDDAPKASKPNELAARLCVPGQRLHICPEWVRFLTRGVDVQSPDNVFQFWWEVWGWGAAGRGVLVDYGVSGRDGLANEIRTRYYDHADGGSKLRAPLTLIDSGNHANDIYAFCREFRGVQPCKGSSTSKFPTVFRLSGLEKSNVTGDKDLLARLGGLVLFEVNHEKTNWWVENSITGLTPPTDPNGIAFPEDMLTDEDFFRQWTAEYPANMVTEDGYDIHEWKKRGRNEWRDAARYAMVAAWSQTNHGKNFNALPPRLTLEQQAVRAAEAAEAARAAAAGGLRTPDGRPFFVANR